MSCDDCHCENEFECGCAQRRAEQMTPAPDLTEELSLAALFEDYKTRLGVPVAERLGVEISEWFASRDGRRAQNDAALARYLDET